jgi:lysine 2,3-aminomutase
MSKKAPTLRGILDLARAGLVAPTPVLDAVAARYQVAVTGALAALMEPGAADDPIRRQFIPDARELETAPFERADPIGDAAKSPLRGLVHRYPDRVLLTPVLVCPVYCRFCFRRSRVGDGAAALSEAEIAAALAYVAERPGISEIILTGGDPLMMGPKRLGDLVGRAAAIPHVQQVRVHSRLPVADPDRVGPAMVRALKSPPGKAVWLAIHVNHPRELSDGVAIALGRLADGGVPLLSQTVLLKGVNDDADVLDALMRALVRHRVRPYYLHHLDPAPGTAHFRVSIARGQALMGQLRGRLSGIAQPCYVLDIPDGFGKVPVGPSYWNEAESSVSDPNGGVHPYDLGRSLP